MQKRKQKFSNKAKALADGYEKYSVANGRRATASLDVWADSDCRPRQYFASLDIITGGKKARRLYLMYYLDGIMICEYLDRVGFSFFLPNTPQRQKIFNQGVDSFISDTGAGLDRLVYPPGLFVKEDGIS